MYADYVSFFIQAKDLEKELGSIQNYLNKIQSWATHWKFKFSVNKSNIVIFSHKRNPHKLTLTLNNTQIPISNSQHFLGIIFDSKLNWKKHLEYLNIKLERKVNILKILINQNHYLNFKSISLIFSSTIRSVYDYSFIPILSSSISNLKPIKNTLNCIMRVILGAFKSTPIPLLNIETGIEPIDHRAKYLLTSYICKIYSRFHHPMYTTCKNMITNNSIKWKPRSTPTIVKIKDFIINTYPDSLYLNPPESPVNLILLPGKSKA